MSVNCQFNKPWKFRTILAVWDWQIYGLQYLKLVRMLWAYPWKSKLYQFVCRPMWWFSIEPWVMLSFAGLLTIGSFFRNWKRLLRYTGMLKIGYLLGWVWLVSNLWLFGKSTLVFVRVLIFVMFSDCESWYKYWERFGICTSSKRMSTVIVP